MPVADLALVGAYALALALIAPLSVEGDGTFYYDLTRRLVGDGGIVYAYQWGTSLWNAPFYVAWHALGLPAPVPPPHMPEFSPLEFSELRHILYVKSPPAEP